jgi:hypothetical protein
MAGDEQYGHHTNGLSNGHANGTTSAHASQNNHEKDGYEEDPPVIVGLSIKFPGDATSGEGLWTMMQEKRSATTPFPTNRFSKQGFCNGKNKRNTA